MLRDRAATRRMSVQVGLHGVQLLVAQVPMAVASEREASC